MHDLREQVLGINIETKTKTDTGSLAEFKIHCYIMNINTRFEHLLKISLSKYIQ